MPSDKSPRSHTKRKAATKPSKRAEIARTKASPAEEHAEYLARKADYDAAISDMRSQPLEERNKWTKYAEKYNVYSWTLRRRFLDLSKHPRDAHNSQQILSHVQREVLAEWLEKMKLQGDPIDDKELRQTVKLLTGKLPHPSWVRRFRETTSHIVPPNHTPSQITSTTLHLPYPIPLNTMIPGAGLGLPDLHRRVGREEQPTDIEMEQHMDGMQNGGTGDQNDTQLGGIHIEIGNTSLRRPSSGGTSSDDTAIPPSASEDSIANLQPMPRPSLRTPVPAGASLRDRLLYLENDFSQLVLLYEAALQRAERAEMHCAITNRATNDSHSTVITS